MYIGATVSSFQEIPRGVVSRAIQFRSLHRMVNSRISCTHWNADIFSGPQELYRNSLYDGVSRTVWCARLPRGACYCNLATCHVSFFQVPLLYPFSGSCDGAIVSAIQWISEKQGRWEGGGEECFHCHRRCCQVRKTRLKQ